jgi:polysaccharide biosynthesis transport protein
MSQFNDVIAPHANPAYPEPPSPETAAPPEQEQPIQRLRRILRGRWGWAVGLFLIGALGAGVGGWFLTPRTYRSTGIVRLRAYVPPVLQKEGGALPMYENFLQSQEAVIQSSHVIGLALNSTNWAKTGLGQSSEVVSRFVDDLTFKRIGEVITVTYEHQDPDVAVAGAQAVIGAYADIYKGNDAKSQQDTVNTLQDRRNILTASFNAQRDRIATIAGDQGSAEGLERVRQFRVDEDARIDAQVQSLKMSIALAKSRGKNPAATQPEMPSLAVLSLTNSSFQSLWQRRQSYDLQLEQLRMRFGPDHRSVLEAQEALKRVDDEVQALALQMKDRGIDLVTGTPGSARTPVEELEAQLVELNKLYVDSQRQLKDLAARSLQIQAIQADMVRTQQSLEETKQRLDQLNVEEKMVSGRLEVVDPSRPLFPSSDKRRQRAILGGAAGGLLGFGLVVLLGIMDRRIRSSDDARAYTAPASLLGTLPQLPTDLSDQLQAHLAARCVHHIRAVLQVGLGPTQQHVLAVSSASDGVGKTSLTLAMGLSYAESGARVLLIDGDLHGGGLTLRLGAIVRRRLGRLLLARGRVTREQLDAALDRAQRSKRRLGEVLLEQGTVTSQELDEVLSAQQEGRLGLLEALADGELAAYVTPTGTPSLFIVPRGQASEADASRVSPTAIERLVAQARTQFDVVIMDTGPVVGSVESSLLCAAADNVLLVTARGEDRRLLARALTMLQSVNAHLAGIVYNRADAKDFDRSVSTYQSQRLPAAGHAASPAVPPAGDAIPGGDPARSVASALVASRPPHPGA